MNLTDTIIIGAQYYRPPNPPREAWERDLRLMAEKGMNTVKLWACWSWMNPEQGRYDFDDLDRLFELAGRVGLKVVVNIILEDAPYWLEQNQPNARYHDEQGRAIHLGAAMNTPGGGWPGLCFDNDAVMQAGLEFLSAVVGRYQENSALLSWDVWNEPHLEPASYFPEKLFCYCDASVSRFRQWLQEKYQNLDALNEGWARRFSDWSQVEPPRLFEAVPDMMDWREFWFENLRTWLDARVAAAKVADKKHPIMTHVALSGFTGQLATHTLDEWTLAGAVDGFGTSSFPTWLMDDDLVEHMMNLDTARAAAVGKVFWQTELQGGRGRRDGLKSTPHPRPEIVALEMWNALATGARGVLFWQWRPELLGPESPGYGLCAIDGSPTRRTQAASDFAAMVKRLPELTRMTPISSGIGLIVSRRTSLHAFATDRTMDVYRQSVMGAYRMLLDAGIAVEFVHEDDIENGRVPESISALYYPMPAVVSDPLAERLENWVRKGGRLVSETVPGAYDARGWHRPDVPPPALRSVLGARSVETDAFAGSIEFELDGAALRGGWLRDQLVLEGAERLASFADGEVAICRNAHGEGEAILIATCPSTVYATETDTAMRTTIAGLLGTTARLPIQSRDPAPGVLLRPHAIEGGGTAIFMLNWTDQPRRFSTPTQLHLHKIDGDCAIEADQDWEIPPLSGAVAITQ